MGNETGVMILFLKKTCNPLEMLSLDDAFNSHLSVFIFVTPCTQLFLVRLWRMRLTAAVHTRPVSRSPPILGTARTAGNYPET